MGSGIGSIQSYLSIDQSVGNVIESKFTFKSAGLITVMTENKNFDMEKLEKLFSTKVSLC